MDDDRLATLTARLNELRTKRKALDERIDTVQQQVCREMERRGASALVLEGLRVTWIQQERVEYLVDKCAKALSPALFKKVTKPAIDKEKLEEAVMAGELTMDKVAKFTKVSKNKPYVSITTEKKA